MQILLSRSHACPANSHTPVKLLAVQKIQRIKLTHLFNDSVIYQKTCAIDVINGQ